MFYNAFPFIGYIKDDVGRESAARIAVEWMSAEKDVVDALVNKMPV